MNLQRRLWVGGLAIVCSACTAREETPLEPDSTPPAVAIVHPTPGADVADTVRVEITATDNQRVARVTLTVDGIVVGHDYEAPWIIPWSTGDLPDSTRSTLMAEAVDERGNLALSKPCEVRIIANHAPEIEILWPPDGLWIDLARSQPDWQCRASDPDGDLVQVHWTLDAAALEAMGPRIPAHNLAEGEHRITAVAVDDWGRQCVAGHSVRGFLYSTGAAPTAIWHDFVAALGARDASVATELLAPDFSHRTPRGALWPREQLASALSGILADSTRQVLKIAASAPASEIFVVADREFAKVEVRDLSVEQILLSAEESRAVRAGAARIFLTREGGPWQIVAWWDLHGATWAPGGALSWSAWLAEG